MIKVKPLYVLSGPSEGLKVRVSPLVEIGLTDLPKSGCATAHPGTTSLFMESLPNTANLKFLAHSESKAT